MEVDENIPTDTNENNPANTNEIIPANTSENGQADDTERIKKEVFRRNFAVYCEAHFKELKELKQL